MVTDLQEANPRVRTSSQAPFVLEADAKAVHDIHRVRRALQGRLDRPGAVNTGPSRSQPRF